MVAIDKLLKSIKNKIASRYSSLVVKMQVGYPTGNYDILKEAIYAVEYVESYNISDAEKIRILDYYILQLTYEK